MALNLVSSLLGASGLGRVSQRARAGGNAGNTGNASSGGASNILDRLNDVLGGVNLPVTVDDVIGKVQDTVQAVKDKVVDVVQAAKDKAADAIQAVKDALGL